MATQPWSSAYFSDRLQLIVCSLRLSVAISAEHFGPLLPSSGASLEPKEMSPPLDCDILDKSVSHWDVRRNPRGG